MDCQPSTSTYSPIDNSVDCQPSTSNCEPFLSINSEKRKLTDFGQDVTNIKLGDIVWCKIFNFPFWPGIVCIDPVDNTYIQVKDDKYKIHVRFLNDNCQRNWSKNVEPFISVEELIHKYPKCLVKLKTNKNKIKMWEGAVKEAKELITLKIEERKVQFVELYQLEYESLFDDSPKPPPAAETSAVSEMPKRKTAQEKRQEVEKERADVFQHFLDKYAKPAPNHKKFISNLINHYGVINMDEEKKISEEEEFNKKFNEITLKPSHPSCKLSAKQKHKIEYLVNTAEKEKVRKVIDVKMDNKREQKTTKQNKKKLKK